MLATSVQVEPPNLDNLSHLENVATVPDRLFTPLYEQAQQQHSQPLNSIAKSTIYNTWNRTDKIKNLEKNYEWIE